MALPDAEAYHAVRVLRLREGEHLTLLDGAGGRATGVSLSVNANRRHEQVTCRVDAVERWTPPACRLHLLVAPPRARFMDQLIQQATELGVGRITPIICCFSVARPEADALTHWQAAALAAVKQSGNPFLPRLEAPVDFAAAVKQTAVPGCFGDIPDAAAVPADAASLANAAELAVWIGPEGGFAPAEREALLAKGFRALAVGDWILRVETAVPAVLGALLGSGNPRLQAKLVMPA